MAAVVIQRSTAAVLTLEDLARHCRIDPDDPGIPALLPGMLQSAIASAEAIIRGPLQSALCLEELDAWPRSGAISCELAGGYALESVTVWRGGVQVDLPIDDFVCRQDGNQLQVRPLRAWPQIDARPYALALRYRAGVEKGDGVMPADVLQWLRFRVAALWEYRHEFVDGQLVALPGDLFGSLIRHYQPAGVVL